VNFLRTYERNRENNEQIFLASAVHHVIVGDGWMGLRPAGAMAVAVYAVKGVDGETNLEGCGTTDG